MILLYRLLYLPGLLVALPYYLLRMRRRGGYKKDFQHRLGRFHQLPERAKNKVRIWIQAVSVGEVLAVGPLIEALQARGNVEIVLTTTTSTGYAEAHKHYNGNVLCIGIFPLDFWLFSRLAWKRIQPDYIILTESELWPEHLHQANAKRIPAYLINARMSDRSFRRYKKVPQLAQRLLTKFSATFAASEPDATRLRELGMDNNKLFSMGSIKLDVPLPRQLNEDELCALRTSLGFSGNGDESFILLGSSTWPGEEAALIAITKQLREEGLALRLLLVPRHAERGLELRRSLEQQELPWHQRSIAEDTQEETIIYLADTTGELNRLSQVADIAFIGKSLPPNDGGQSPIEIAGNGIPLLMGPHMSNFKEVSKSLVAAGAALWVKNEQELEEHIRSLIGDKAQRRMMGNAGRDWHQSNRGSSQRIADFILEDI
ncbi:MAG: glycosyltransferase N-terminal domain-containing protein [Verrucomicrobiota bacterium]